MSNVIPLHRRTPVVDLGQAMMARRVIKSTAKAAVETRLREEIPQILHDFAREKGSVRAAAAALGVRPRTYEGWEDGKALPRTQDLIFAALACRPLRDLLADVLGIEVRGLSAAEEGLLQQIISAGSQLAKRQGAEQGVLQFG